MVFKELIGNEFDNKLVLSSTIFDHLMLCMLRTYATNAIYSCRINKIFTIVNPINCLLSTQNLEWKNNYI